MDENVRERIASYKKPYSENNATNEKDKTEGKPGRVRQKMHGKGMVSCRRLPVNQCFDSNKGEKRSENDEPELTRGTE